MQNGQILSVQFNEFWQMHTTVKPTPRSKYKTFLLPTKTPCTMFPIIHLPQCFDFHHHRLFCLILSTIRTGMWHGFFCVWLPLLTILSLGFIFLVVYVSSSYFSLLSSVSLHEHTRIYWPIFLLIDIWVVYISGLLCLKLLETFLYKYFCSDMFPFLSLKSLRWNG